MIKEGSRVELIANAILEGCIGCKNLEVSPKKPCKGTVKSMKGRRYGKTWTRVVHFAPDIAPDKIYEFTIKNFREIKEEYLHNTKGGTYGKHNNKC